MRIRLLLVLPLLAAFALLLASRLPAIDSSNAAAQPAIMPTLNPALGVIDPSPFTPTTDFPDAIPGALGPVHFPLDVNPLTGETMDDPSVLQRRPIVAKISNGPPLVRPQSGIGQADLVFEHYTEGGITRLSAVFYGQAPRRIGSIRSARLIDYELVEMYKGLLAFSGASIGVEERLNGSEFGNRLYKGVLYGQPYYWRDESIEVPHNMFTNAAALWDLAVERGHDQRPLLRGMAFHPEVPAGSTGTVNRIDVRYRATRVFWDYDADSGRYLRTADGKPHFDSILNEQISAANVVIIYAGHYLTDIVESVWQDSVSYSAQITVWPEGRAELFRDGQHYSGQWVRSTRPDLLGLRTDAGELLYLKPGNTWFQLVRPPEQMNPDEEWVEWE